MLKTVLGGHRQGTLLSGPQERAFGFNYLIFGPAGGTLKSVPCRWPREFFSILFAEN
jgi:hypothetical protein